MLFDYQKPEYKSKSWDLYDLWSGVSFDEPDADNDLNLVEGSPFSQTLGNITVAPHQTKLFRMVPSNETSSSTKRSDGVYLRGRNVRGLELVNAPFAM